MRIVHFEVRIDQQNILGFEIGMRQSIVVHEFDGPAELFFFHL